MSKWIAEFDLEDGDTMPEHMDLNCMGAKIDFYCRPMWIPVSERLPEVNKEVIVTDNEVSDTYASRYLGGGYWQCDNGTYKDRIVAWTPLPKRYEPQESEDKG